MSESEYETHELTPRQVAEVLRVHRKTVMKWLHRALQGKSSPIPPRAIRLNSLSGHWYIDAKAIAPLVGQARVSVGRG